MFSPSKKINRSDDYEFPFTPYNIQQELMDAVYDTLTNKSIGIFESPTGTGKSLTLTCSVLRWIEDRELMVRRELMERISNMEQDLKRINDSVDVAKDWLSVSYAATEKKRELGELQRLQKLVRVYDERLKKSVNVKQKYLKRGKSIIINWS
ncbi:unnamed protein product [Ceratitis capitata]|uniref:(Mediterranean fruit fly) hypothetical protein n=1 Tax=Ceratitis capitata TaxID=7213 RepID=A0A811UJL9_CERCA|nr:unnamed protein product [Ceratitis capitata]